MEVIADILTRAIEELAGRASGPMHIRLIMQPVAASFLAIKAGLRDAREGRPAFLWTLLTSRDEERKALAHSGWKHISKVFVIAFAFDTLYQLIELRAFYIVQALIVAIGVAVIPYLLVRSITTRIARLFKVHLPKENPTGSAL